MNKRTDLNYAHLLILLALIASAIGVCIYVDHYVVDTVSRDEWRFFDVLRHYYNHQPWLQDVWGTHSQQRTPGYKLFFLANAVLFGLNTLVANYVGIAVYSLFCIFLYLHCVRQPRPEPDNSFYFLSFAPLVIALFSFSQNYFYEYDLLAFSALISTALSGAIWILLDRYERPPTAARYIGILVLLLVSLLFFASAKAPALVVATLAMGVFALMRQQEGRKRIWLIYGLIVLISVLVQLLYWSTGPSIVAGPSLVDRFAVVAGDFGGALSYAMRALGASVLSDELRSVARLPRPLFLATGAGVAALYIACAATYLYKRLYRQTLLPIPFIIFAVLFICELLIGRFAIGVDNGGAQRYIHETHLGLIGCLLVLVQLMRNWHKEGKAIPAYGLLLVSLTVLGTLQYYNVRTALVVAPFDTRNHAEAIHIAKERAQGGNTPYPRWYCPDEELCDANVQFMRKHDLNIYRSD